MPQNKLSELDVQRLLGSFTLKSVKNNCTKYTEYVVLPRLCTRDKKNTTFFRLMEKGSSKLD